MRKFLFISVLFFTFFSWGELKAQTISSEQESSSQVIYPSSFSVTRPLRDLVAEQPLQLPYVDEDDVWVSPDRKNRPHQTFVYTAADGPQYGNDSTIIQQSMGKRNISNRAPLTNWAGITSNSYPPDPTGAVSDNHYIQSVNATTVRIYDKTGTALSSFAMGTLWGLSANAGDPIIMYDKFADRWFISQFGSSNEIYIAISQTSDPLGSYYTYTYVSPQFPDYLKFSIWADGYYMTSNQSTDKVYVFERDEMLVGNGSARGIFSTFTTGSVGAFYVPLPADAADNDVLPAVGTPLPFMSYYDNAWGGGTDGVKIWNMSTNWTTGTATITGPIQVNTGSFDASYDPSWDDVPQPNGQELDGIGGVLGYRAPWRSWSGYNNLVLSWGVLISNSPRQRAIYWCELRQDQSTGTWSLYQEGIYNPDSDTRWMGSAAMDDNGSIALCYAKSSTTVFPGLYYTGRLAGDPLGTMTFAETEVVAGTGSQSTYNRFGDYAQTSLDPDGITFWHTGEYVLSTTGQETRIYSFQLPAGPLPPVANFIVDKQTPFCTNTVQFTDWSSNLPTSWEWDFGDGNTSTAQNPSHTYAANGTYTVELIAINALGRDTLTRTSYVTINTSQPPTASGASRCGTGTVTLTASGANTLNWYDALTGGNYVGTGASWITPSLSATTTYYVENVIAEPSQNVGPSIVGTTLNTTVATYLTFDVDREMTLISVDAKRKTNGSVVIELQDNTGTTLESTTATIATSATTVPLNWTIPAGTGYRLVTPANSRLFYISSASYPYSIAGLVSITGNSAGSAFYTSYFNWVVQGGGCTSSRVPATATINTSVAPSVSIAASSTTICSGDNVTFTPTPTNGGTPTYQWKVNGSNAGTGSTFSSTGLNDGDVITVEMTSTESCAVPATVSSSGITMTVNSAVTPSVTVAPSATTICAGTNVIFTPTPTNGGTPSYQWKVNGSNAGTGSTFSSTGLNDGDVVTVVMTSTESCASPTTATSAGITMTVNSSVTPSVAVSPTATSICSGTNVIFTASPTNGGTPSYQWKVNGSNAGTGSTFSSTGLNDGDVITVEMTSTESCASPTTATSAPITMTVTPSVTPSVAVSPTATTICSGTNVIFTASPTNGGTPSYQWKVNGSNAGTGSTFSSTGLNDGDVITVEMTSTESCASPTTATSAPITMTVSPSVTPAVSVSPSATTICSGTNVTFTASPTNGGTPSYQWIVNGSNAGTGSTFSSTGLNDGDVITVEMTSSETCASPTTATSSPVTMTVNSTLIPSVSVSPSATTICSGSNIIFTATPTNGGTPSYQWKVNGSNAGTGSTYSSTGLNDGDVVTVEMTSTETCASPATATSSPITISVNSTLTPSVSVSPTSTTICSGDNVVFTATPTNGGTPAYQWKVNGSNAGIGSTFSSTGLNDGDVVTVEMTSTESCASPTTASSAPITMTVSPSVTPSVAVSPSATTICAGTNVTFTATPTNGGTPSYQWYVNSSPAGTGSTFSSTGLNNGDMVTVEMTSTEACVTTATATSSPVTMTVNTVLTPTVAVTPSATTICSGTNVTFSASPTNGGTPSYQWYVNSSPAGTGSTFSSTGLNDGDVVTVEMTSTETCVTSATATSSPVTMTVNSVVTPSVAVSPSATTICAGTNVTFTATPTNGGTPSYQWKVNGSNAGTGSTFSSTGLNDGDAVTVEMTSTETCVTSATATSSPVTMIVNPILATSVAVTPSATTICSGTNVSFSASPTNGGTPSYQWKVNGSNAGTGSTYSSTGLNDGDVVTVEMTSTATCASPTTATSAPITMSVNATLVPSVSVTSSATTICTGTNVSFTASPTNGGTPSYQWYVNSLPVGTGSSYSSSTLNNGDVVTCEMTSTEACASPTTATSSPVTMTVNTNLTPSVSVSPSATSVCEGTNVTFTATPTNGGTPVYQWLLNGGNVGSNSSTYSSSVLSSSDVIVCEITSSETCVTTATAQSAPVSITVNTLLTPAVSINTSATTVCQGTSVSFSATPTNGGSTPSFEWFVNGFSVGTGSTFNTSGLVNNDAISCVLTSSESCVTSSTANSNIINMNVTTTVVPGVMISSVPAGPVCPGTMKEFTANPTNGGTPSYQWYVDNVPAGTGPTLMGVYNDGQVIKCTMTSTEACASPDTANAMPVTVSIYSVTPVIVTDLGGGVLSSSSATGNQWYEQTAGIVSGETNQTFAPLVNGFYYTIVTDSNGCVDTSNVIEVIVTGISENAEDYSFYPNPTNGMVTITFGTTVDNGQLKIVDAIGKLIYQEPISAEAGSTKQLDFSVYAHGVYFIYIMDENIEIRERIVYE